MADFITNSRVLPPNGDTSTIRGLDIGLWVSLQDFYSFNYNSICYAFEVVGIPNKDQITVSWVLPDGPFFPPSDALISLIYRGKLCGVGNVGTHDAVVHRSGFLGIDNVVFDLFKDILCTWDWSNFTKYANWVEKDKKVPFFFQNKRPITRNEYNERTLGNQDNPDKITHPYIAFYPLATINRFEEYPRVDEWYRYLPDPKATGSTNADFYDLEEYQSPQIYDFEYQLTGVADNWKDMRILKSLMDHYIFPFKMGSRFVTFPSGFTHAVVVESHEINHLSNQTVDRGIFEYVVIYRFTLPMVEQLPELTHQFLTGTLYVNGEPHNFIEQ